MIEKTWQNFSKSINGQLKTQHSSTFNSDNVVEITTAEESIKFVWGELPEEGKGPFVNISTTFYYNFYSNKPLKIYICPNDFLGKILGFLRPSRIKVGDTEIDKKYLFFCSSKSLMSFFYYAFKRMNDINCLKDFVIYTEVLDTEKRLVIQVNKLLIEEEEINRFYKLGQSIIKEINNGI